MKEIILVRHGKSSWDYDVADKDRPLKLRGIQDGHRVAREIKQDFPVPDAVFSSPANRALHTCMILMRSLELPFGLLTVADDLYDFSGSSVAAFAAALDNDLDRVVFFGHNHAFTHLANSWGDQAVGNVPTSGLVHLRFDVSRWGDISSGKTLRTVFPKHLK
ncbi:histidine phosphatase family protein [Robiginitalea sp. SC105]|uniref:SixA phosphatase family protein n=1 Tax=Robiginitalea sp. SC105 TaxID=2762332 RepID=UPI00163A09B8|nr:histidine phosphatase family protein [Robiginitalea sp. SC105]MBC2840209.1 histidine phosphatase family protein [Robiginitalea sp. SC105]